MTERGTGAARMSRRGFMKTGAAGAVAGAAAGAGCAGMKSSAPGVKKVKMVKLGRTGLKVSMFLGDRMADPKMYELAVAAGVNYWHKFGQWVAPAPYEYFRSLDRDSFYTDTVVHTLEYDKAIELFNRYLKTSGFERIDGFKVHSVYEKPEDIKNKTGVIKAYEELKKQGKTRYLMLSQHINVPDVLEAAIESDLFDVIQVPVNPVMPRPDVFNYSKKADDPQEALQKRYFALFQKAREKNIAITAMKVFLYGTKNWNNYPDLKDKVKKYLPDDQSIASALIHYAMSIPGVVAYGSMLYNFEELRQNIEEAGGKLTLAERKGIERFADAMCGKYCPMCGACERANPNGVAVSTIMRYRGYVQGFEQTDDARSFYAALPKHARVDGVSDLSSYERACPYGIPLAEVLTDTHTMLA